MADQPKYKPKTVLFATPKLAGGRFDESALPLELLPELDRFRTLVLEIAKVLFRTRTGRQRVPAGFEEDLKLRLTGIDKGSTILPIARELPTAPLLAAQAAGRIPDEEAEDYPDYDDALVVLKDTIDSLSRGAQLPSSFPPDLLPVLEDFGAAFEPEEVFELRRPGEATGARLDIAARLRMRAADDTQRVERFVGTITSFDWDGSFKLRPIGGTRTVPGKHNYRIQEDLLTALKQKQFTRVRLAADTRFTPDGIPKQIVEVLSLALWSGTDEATVRQVESRFGQLAAIGDGWLDGEGRAIDPDLVEWVKDWIIRMMVERSIPKPRLYPTPDGNVEAEWSLGRYELTATFDLLTQKARLHAANLDDEDDEHEAEAELARARGDDTFVEFFERFSSPEEAPDV